MTPVYPQSRYISSRIFKIEQMKRAIKITILLWILATGAGKTAFAEIDAFAFTFKGNFGEVGNGELVVYTISEANVEGQADLGGMIYQINGTYQDDKLQIDLTQQGETRYIIDAKTWKHGELKGKLIKDNWGDKLGKISVPVKKETESIAQKDWVYQGNDFPSLDVAITQSSQGYFVTIIFMRTENTSYNYWNGQLKSTSESFKFMLEGKDECMLLIQYDPEKKQLSIQAENPSDLNCSAIENELIFYPTID